MLLVKRDRKFLTRYWNRKFLIKINSSIPELLKITPKPRPNQNKESSALLFWLGRNMEKSAVKSRKRMSWEVGLTMSFWLTAQSCDSVFSVAWQLHVITKKLILSWNRLHMVIYVGRYSCSGKTILFLVSVSVSRLHMMNCSTSPAGCILPKKVKSDSALERGCADKNKTKKKPHLVIH